MAKILPSSLVSSISGNLGGINFSSGRSGQYVRRSILRTNARTSAQLFARAQFQLVVRHWNSFTEEERLTWNNAGRWGVQKSSPTPSFSRSGFHYFMAYQLSTYRVPTFPRGFPSIGRKSLPALSPSLTPLVASTITLAWTQAQPQGTYWIFLQGSQPHSAKIRTIWRNFKALPPLTTSGGTPSIDIRSSWETYMNPVQSGERIAIRFAMMFEGWLLSPYTLVSALVP